MYFELFFINLKTLYNISVGNASINMNKTFESLYKKRLNMHKYA